MGLCRAALGFQCRVAAIQFRDLCDTHVLQRLDLQCGSPRTGTEEDQGLPGGECGLVLGAGGIDPKSQHAARGTEGARNAPVAPQLARIADIDQKHVIAGAVFVRGQGGNLGLCGGDEVVDRCNYRAAPLLSQYPKAQPSLRGSEAPSRTPKS